MIKSIFSIFVFITVTACILFTYSVVGVQEAILQTLILMLAIQYMKTQL